MLKCIAYVCTLSLALELFPPAYAQESIPLSQDLEAAPPPTPKLPQQDDAPTTANFDTPLGEGMGSRSPWLIKGYLRGEYKYNRPNLYYGYDEALKLWLPRGSPYTAFSLVPTVTHEAYAELNVEVAWSSIPALSFYTDTSFLFSTVSKDQSTFEQIQDVLIATGNSQPVTAASALDTGVPIPGSSIQLNTYAQERVQINELYTTLDIRDWLSITAGKRRVVWGSAFTWAPMDVVNPPFNPLEPMLLREGSYNLAIDLVHFDHFSATALYRPQVLENARGLPTQWDFRKNLAVGRLYLNILDSDINLALMRDRGRTYGGGSLSRYFDIIELHAESLVQRGRPTWLVRPLSDAPGSVTLSHDAPFEVGQLDLADCQVNHQCHLYADILLGARYAFDDGSFILIEYLYHGTGYDAAEYANYRRFTTYMEEEIPHLLTEQDLSGEPFTEQSLESWIAMVYNAPLLYQETKVRHHYLGFSYLKSEIYDLLEPRVTLIWNMDDLSLTLYPSVDFGFVRGARGPGVMKVSAGFLLFLGDRESQVSLYPARYSANLRLTTRF